MPEIAGLLWEKRTAASFERADVGSQMGALLVLMRPPTGPLPQPRQARHARREALICPIPGIRVTYYLFAPNG